MALLHNVFTEREQKESKGKWKKANATPEFTPKPLYEKVEPRRRQTVDVCLRRE